MFFRRKRKENYFKLGGCMPGLLYPAYQKFYSAISSLERFSKEANFFDNISCLDTFFSEYRNVTFVIQSQLKHTDFYEKYEKNRDKYLTDHWFVEKRNETTKQQPFRFQKRITISIYTPSEEITIAEELFSVENDIPFDSLKNEIQQFFNGFLDEEIFFSTVYSFSEDGEETDLFGRILTGISAIKSLLAALTREIGDKCTLCEQLSHKIDRMAFINVPRDFLLTDDYVYYRRKNEFERAGRLAMMLSLDGKKMIARRPLKEITDANYLNYDGTPFGNFTLMHAILRSVQPNADIMPAIMIVYDDNTYDMDVFHTDIKTTVYRKLNEVAKVIDSEEVKEVCFMSLYTAFSVKEDIPVYSKKRLQSAVSDILVVSSIDFKLNEKEYVFDGNLMSCTKYIGYIMKNGLKNRLGVSRTNLTPVLRAFNNKMN